MTGNKESNSAYVKYVINNLRMMPNLSTWEQHLQRRTILVVDIRVLFISKTSSHMLSRTLMITAYKTIILSIVFSGCETWHLTKEEHKLQVVENRKF
jgi:hypothetical protein